MTANLLEPKIEFPTNSADDLVEHLFCHCDSRFTLCGIYLEFGPPETDAEDLEKCKDCLEMDGLPCMRCCCVIH